jgi:hypothetical protein
MSRYQNSECKRNMLHDYKILETTTAGVFERCTRCGDKKHFPHNVPNHVYISYHIRSALQTNDPRFFIEYPYVTR